MRNFFVKQQAEKAKLEKQVKEKKVVKDTPVPKVVNKESAKKK